MSAATKRKHVVKEMLEDFSMPKSNQTIVQILGNVGSNLHEVLTPDGQTFLASLPMQFRKNIWIKRGDFVVTEPILEGDKVKAEIVRVLYPQHIKAIKQSNLWPSRFENKKGNNITKEASNKIQGDSGKQDSNSSCAKKVSNDAELSDESEDDFSDIPMNTNRPVEVEYESESESSDEES